MRVPINRCVGLFAYALTIGGACLLTLKLSSVLATQAIALSQPYFLEHCPCLPPLVEQRRMVAEAGAAPTADGRSERVAALDVPAIPAGALAAQLDLAEGEVLSARVSH